MSILELLIPVTLGLGLVGLGAYLWCLRNGQYDDLAGDAERIFVDRDDVPLPPRRGPLSRRQAVAASEEHPG
jgi:cbb3-type cytochrome oxidase maturation protein